MTAFVFRLQVLLDRAVSEEEAQALLLAEIQRRQVEASSNLRVAITDRVGLLQRMQAIQQQASNPRDLQMAYLRLDVVTTECANLQRALHELEDAMRAQQQRLTEAMRQRQIYERLREKQAETHRLAAERMAHKLMEDTVLPHYNRLHGRPPADDSTLGGAR